MIEITNPISYTVLFICSHGDVVMYFLYTTSFTTLEQVQNYKSLDSYKCFIAGWVIEHKWKIVNDCCLVIGNVNHSYALSATPLHPWVVVKSSGVVVCGHCTCMAGLSEI